jgi:hypothetical protein
MCILSAKYITTYNLFSLNSLVVLHNALVGSNLIVGLDRMEYS